jgi:hypothetical protein
VPSVADTARANCLSELGLTSSNLSLVDLFRLVKDDPGQVTWTFNSDQSVPVNLWRYLGSLSA